MDYFIDFKYDPQTRTPVTLAIIREDNTAAYFGFEGSVDKITDEWMKENFVPLIDRAPITCRWLSKEQIQEHLTKFFAGDDCPNIITMWPDDVEYFCNLLTTGPRSMIDVKAFTFKMQYVSTYPSEVTPAVMYNAFWDAMALKQKTQFPNGMDEKLLLEIQNELFKFNPVTGETFIQDVYNGPEMRRQHPDVPWYYNPWTGAPRDHSLQQLDPFGEKIKYTGLENV
jgi:hypothetical protein